jgi:polyphosphate kinase
MADTTDIPTPPESGNAGQLAATCIPLSVPTGRVSRVQDPTLYINRELSWLQFNARVLAAAADETIPLFERVKFLAIFSSNLDEFFMVRVAGLQAQLSSGIDEVPPDGLTPKQQLAAISERARDLVAQQQRIWLKGVRPALREAGIALVMASELAPEDQAALDTRFDREIFPVLTPIAVDPAHPFPHVRNKSINVGILFAHTEDPTTPALGVVQVPITLPRLIRVPLAGARRAFVTLEDLIIRNRSRIFPQLRSVGQFAFRVTRNFDIEIDEDEAEDLLLTLQAELRRREQGNAVRLEVTSDAPGHAIEFLCRELKLDAERDVYPIDGPLVVADMTAMAAQDDRATLRDEPFVPQYVPPLRDSDDFFETIREQDVLLHHPYESFEAVVDFLFQAAEDPNVLAVKQTLYRTGGESPNVLALQRAAENGKQVTAVVELKARFDEQSNIRWANALERSGVNVVYGLLGLKTHAKVVLVVRKEGNGLRRYVHLATGNYNQQTARLYEDLSLFTARESFGEDATALFNLLTGYSTPPRMNRIVVAPLGCHQAVIGFIQRETAHARAGRPCGIVAKMNALVDAEVISALYEASEAGVPIDLLIRGICCLRPGVKGVSKGIRVHAIIDRFLEHARIFHFVNGGKGEVYCASADWMPRNFWRRVETLFPIEDEQLKQRVIDEILGTMRADNVSGWLLHKSGEYQRIARGPDEAAVRSQQKLAEIARTRARQTEARLNLPSTAGLPPPAPNPTLETLRNPRGRRQRDLKRDKRRKRDKE